MRRLLVVALLLCLPSIVLAQGGDFIKYYPPARIAQLSSSGTAITSTVPIVLPNGSAAAPSLVWTASTTTGFYNVGGAFLDMSIAGAPKYRWTSTVFGPLGSNDLGSSTGPWNALYVSGGILGARTKALTESSATTVATVAVPQTAGANFAAGEMRYTVYASDGTDTQALNGVALFSAVNKAGTETCTIEDDQITAEAASAGTLTCTVACAVGLVDVVGITFDCASSLVQTSLNALVRLDMQQPNTLVFP